MSERKWKIAADNYDRETVSEWLVCENFRNEETANKVCAFLNEAQHCGEDRWLKVKPQEQPLYEWEP